jgi:hypothetical protein
VYVTDPHLPLEEGFAFEPSTIPCEENQNFVLHLRTAVGASFHVFMAAKCIGHINFDWPVEIIQLSSQYLSLCNDPTEL